MVAGRDANLLHMLNAIFAWEADFEQFKPNSQSHAKFKKLGTRFDWPPDPPDHPNVTFDFGVGISQFTHPGELTTWIAWDWKGKTARLE